jgi:signal transduction histidine kinase
VVARTSARTLRTRQSLFFLVAILLPCAVLVILTLRMLVQERELADRRMADERQRIVGDARQRLLGTVERLRRASNTPGESSKDVVLVARVQDGRVVLPWEDADDAAAAAAWLQQPAFRREIRRGEQYEFGVEQFMAAAMAYQRAAAMATAPVQRAFAELQAARALTKAGRRSDALDLALRVLRAPGLVDDQAIPFAVYAARLIADLANGREDGALIASLDAVIASPTIGPAALYMTADAATKLRDAGALRTRVAGRAVDFEQAIKLRDAFPTMGLTATDASEPVWVTFGSADTSWLVSVAPDATGGARLIAIRATAALETLPSTVRISAHGEPLAPHFPTLRVSMAPETEARIAAENARHRPVYLAVLALVVSVALFGGYLFWRDVRREIRVAELRSQFVSSVSHELKTPLTAIRMFAETLLLARSGRPEVQREYLETIVNETERLTRLLNNVLDFSTIESGRKSYQLEPHSLPAVVHAAVKAMQYPLAQQGFDLRVSVDENLPLVALDADAVQQAVLNLLSNALKYSGDGRVIELSLTRAGSNAVIAVTDRGVGIPPDEHQRIFEKFYRVRDESTERIAGTGLGLTLVDHVIRAHGGRVELRSAPGAGSTFAIHLPLAPAGSSAPQPAGAIA